MSLSPWNSPIRVALFGTSADPPHQGHHSILTWLAQTYDHVAVWAADNPFKPRQSPLPHRAEMLRLLIDTLPGNQAGHPNVSLQQQLSDRYTVRSIHLARQIWPQARFSLVVGADLVAQLPKWYQAQAIFNQVDILVFPRPGYHIEGAALNTLRQQVTVEIACPPHQYDIASSTYRRTNCGEIPNDLPVVIRDYITAHDLYPCLPKPKEKISTHR